MNSKLNQFNLHISNVYNFRFNLYPKDIRSLSYKETYSTSNKNSTVLPLRKSITYRGEIEENGYVRLTVTDDFIYGIFKTKNELMVIDQLKYVLKDNSIPDNHLIFYEYDEVINSSGYCGTVEELSKSQSNENNIEAKSITTGCRILEVATDADYEYFNLYGNNSNNRIIGEFNNIQPEYADTFDLEVVIVNQNVWTSANDPYSSFNSATINTEIANTWQTTFGNVKRDLVHMFTGKDLGNLYGRASAIGDVCNSNSANSYTVDRINAFPTTGHEIGHNLSGIHGDGVQCGTLNASVMCQGDKEIPIYFSNASINRIENYISTNSSCFYEFNGISSISGDDGICVNGTETYTIDIPIEADITWSLVNSGYASIISGQGTTSVTVKGLNNGNTQLKATIDLNGSVCSNIVEFKNIVVGTLVAADLRLRDPYTNNPVYVICNGQSTTVKATHDSGLIPDNWQWSISGASVYYPYSSNNSLATIHPYSYNVTVKIRAYNSCGWSDWANVSPGIMPCGMMFFTVSPNPAQSEITINTIEDFSNNTSPINDKGVKEYLSVEIELYEINGNRIKQMTFNKNDSMKINISHLKRGMYFLKIIAGEIQETHQLMIN